MIFETNHTNDTATCLPGTPAPPTGGTKNSLVVALCMALVLITLAVYLPVAQHRFLSFDDDVYVTNNLHIVAGVTGQNIRWAITSVEAGNWHPLTWLSHMADVQLFGMEPRGHHLTNLALHTFSALLVLLLFIRMTGAVWQSFFVAALFALHPLHVESVAWVAERKDVLSGLFWFLTLFLYAGYAANRTLLAYISTLGCFMLGLMAKPMLVTLPLVMMLLDIWPLQRYRNEQPALNQLLQLIKEKIPFFACALASGIITMYAQDKGGAISDLAVVSGSLRIENALVAYVTYIGKTLWPAPLAILYPFPHAIPLWQVFGSVFILLSISAAAIRCRRCHPFVTIGWFWFLITLVPVIGFIQVGSQSMADRYTYIPLIGLFVMVAWSCPDLISHGRYRQWIPALLAAASILASAALTRYQLGYWQDSVSLYRHTLSVTTGNYLIHNNLGVALEKQGDLDGAIEQYRKALLISPNYSDAHYNLGVTLQTKGRLNEALREYQEALRINPANTDAHNNLAAILVGKGYLDEAIREYQLILMINPANPDAHCNLGLALAMKGDVVAAIREYQEALRINPDNAKAALSLRQAMAY